MLIGTARAAIIHVPADQPTIQQAIDVANNADLILVSPGSYNENIDYHGKAIWIRGVAGPAQTIIDGGNAGAVVTFQTGEGQQSVLAGFTIQHGNALFGGGITLLGASPTITRNIFRENAQGVGGFGAAIGGNDASPVIERNMFEANTCDAQSLSGVVSFVNSSSPLIINNTFHRNPCRAINMTLPEGNTPVVANNTIVGNSVGLRTQAGMPLTSQLFVNNLVVANGIGLQVDFLDPGCEVTWSNNLVSNNTTNYSGIADQTGFNGNISVNPQFCKRGFQLQPSSPAIDAGTLSVPNLPSIDFAGNPRVTDGDGNGSALPDIGALEFNR